MFSCFGEHLKNRLPVESRILKIYPRLTQVPSVFLRNLSDTISIWKTVVFNVTDNNSVAEFPLQCNNNKFILFVCC